MKVNNEQLVVFIVLDEHVCKECISTPELSDITANDIVTEEALEKEDPPCSVFCDRCKKKIY